MVMARMGICFTPESSIVMPGLPTRPLVDPEVVREVSLVTVAGRRLSPAVASFVRAIRADPSPVFASRKAGDAGGRTRDGRARSGNRPPCQQGVRAI